MLTRSSSYMFCYSYAELINKHLDMGMKNEVISYSVCECVCKVRWLFIKKYFHQMKDLINNINIYMETRYGRIRFDSTNILIIMSVNLHGVNIENSSFSASLCKTFRGRLSYSHPGCVIIRSSF